MEATNTKLAKAGDECQSCKPFWEARGKPPRRLIAVDDKTTEAKGIQVLICPWCDGDAILSLNK